MENNLINEAPKKRTYDFVDNIRCIAMMAVVAEHSISASVALTLGSANEMVYYLATQVTKFGTISFFLLAGFLIGDKFNDYKPGEYLKRRFRNTFGPYLFWAFIFLICFAVNLKVKANIYHDDRFNMANIWQEVQDIFLYTNYWFIINFMVGITILLIFRRYLYQTWFGMLLMACTLFYSVNAHTAWINPSHTTAILGYVFFLWLGAQMRKHWDVIEAALQRLSYGVIILVVLVTYAASYWETMVLTRAHSIDNINTLRFSNILYTLAIFGLLLKVRTFRGINFLRPRQTTYGVYLVHPIIMGFLVVEILRPLHVDVNAVSVAGYLGYKILFFLLTYGITIGVVMLLNKTRAKVLVGN